MTEPREVNPARPSVAIEKLFGQCFEASEFEDGALIPVGGSSIFSNNPDIAVVGDFRNFTDFFQEANEAVSSYNLAQLEDWLKLQGIEIDAKLFAYLFAFTKTYERRYTTRGDLQTDRQKTYVEAGEKEINLSKLFAKRTVACAEIAALAKYFLQQAGIQAKFFSGDVLWESKHEFSDKHSFIVIPQANRIFIYDPTNPTNTTQGSFPSLYITDSNFEQLVRTNQKRFVSSANVISKRTVYFGVNNGTNITQQAFLPS